jgi:hypothetical protein
LPRRDSPIKENPLNHNLPHDPDLRLLVRDRLGLDIGPEMIRYLAAQSAEPAHPIPIIGQDARTGIPRRLMIDPQFLQLEPS